MLQLPLYAMAAQRLVFADEGTSLFDMGYWSLRDEGFKPIAFESWEQDQAALVAHVFALVEQIRQGVFVVHSRTPGCENFCEYRGVCRVRQVRAAGKQHEVPLPVFSVRPRRGRKKTADRPMASGPDSSSSTSAVSPSGSDS
jgi:hypothetical protein